jgi:Cu(I)/Ag(I) efflux system membrane fusion protein
VWVDAEVYEHDLGHVRVGQPAQLELPAYPGELQAGQVRFISPVLDSRTRTARVRVELRNHFDVNGPRLRPGMSGTVSLGLATASGLFVPAEAVVDTGERRYVFVAKEGGHFQPRPVEVGSQHGDQLEIRKGLSEGENVVTTGNFLLDSESRLRAAIEGHAPSP